MYLVKIGPILENSYWIIENKSYGISRDTNSDPGVLMKCNIIMWARTLAVLNVRKDIDKTCTNQLYEFQPNSLLSHEHSNLVLIYAIHKIDSTPTDQISFVVITLSLEKV